MQKLLSQLFFSRTTHCPHEKEREREREKEAFQVAVIRWYYVYDPWRNIKEVGRGGDTNAVS